MTDVRVRFTVVPRRGGTPTRPRGRVAALAVAVGIAPFGGALAMPHAVGAQTGTPGPQSVAPNSAHTYLVTPTGTGMRNLSAVLAHVAKAGDTIELADGVYRTGNLNVTVPNLTIRAEHMPAA